MTEQHIWWGVALVLGAVLGSVVRSGWLRIRLWWRFRRARRAEDDAQRLLQRLGYRIVDVQAPRQISMVVDGEEQEVLIQPDLLAERRGRRYLVEVKTGQKAPNPAYIPTRRQLLEYAVAYSDHEILLLDMETQTCRRIEFPGLAGRSAGWPAWTVATAIGAVGAAVGWLLLR